MRFSRRTVAIAVVVLGIAGFIGLMAVGLANRSAVTGLSGITRVGKPARPFTMPLFDGGEFALSDHIGQPVVINFWASWCPPCIQEAPVLEQAWRRFEGEGVVFVGVDIQDAEEAGRAFLEGFDITYLNGVDTDGAITVAYGVIGLPVTFFINRGGVVERRWVGAIRAGQLSKWVEELLAGVGENLDEFFKPK